MSEPLKSSRGVQLLRLANGRFQVVADGTVVVETAVDSYANIAYDEAVDARDENKDRRQRERAHYDMQAVRSDSFARRAAAARKTGGKGGRGGV
ncbi:hypothetical protein [Nocardia nova]|uniref:hypothetical protein n=1 Tax=Nocardia nova TaxID=37330 RepID=UPI0033ED55D3